MDRDEIPNFIQSPYFLLVKNPANFSRFLTILSQTLQKIKDLPISKTWKYRFAMKRFLWFIAMSRNAITLFLACVLTHYFETYHGTVPYEKTGNEPNNGLIIFSDMYYFMEAEK